MPRPDLQIPMIRKSKPARFTLDGRISGSALTRCRTSPALVYDEDERAFSLHGPAADLRLKTNGENAMAGNQQVMGG